MPITMDIDYNNKLTLIKHIGDIADKEFISKYAELYKLPEFRNASKRLIDLRNTSSKNRSSNALKIVENFSRELYKETQHKIQIAIVIKKTVSFGLARMYEAFSSPMPIDIKIFNDYEDALKWLNIKSI